jgi:hypothetical protein
MQALLFHANDFAFNAVALAGTARFYVALAT